MTVELERLVQESRRCAKFYAQNPGLVGPGVIVDIYQALAILGAALLEEPGPKVDEEDVVEKRVEHDSHTGRSVDVTKLKWPKF